MFISGMCCANETRVPPPQSSMAVNAYVFVPTNSIIQNIDKIKFNFVLWVCARLPLFAVFDKSFFLSNFNFLILDAMVTFDEAEKSGTTFFFRRVWLAVEQFLISFSVAHEIYIYTA